MKPITIIAICAICAATLMSGCVDQGNGEDCEGTVPIRHAPPAVAQITIPDEPTTLYRNVFDECPESLKRYNRNGDSYLNKFELKVLETDFFYKRLTPTESKEFVSLIGYTPNINWNPPPTTDDKVYKKTSATSQIVFFSTTSKDSYYSHGDLLTEWGHTFETYMNSEWNDDNQYELNAFDCSQMAAYQEWALENSGYRTVIRTGYYEDGTGHAWIITDRNGDWLAYECTRCYWVYPDDATARKYEPYGYMVNPSFYTAGIEFDSIHDVAEYWSEEITAQSFIREFGWWVD